MPYSSLISKISILYSFLGKRVIGIGLGSLLMGIVIFALELSLAFSLQALFYVIDLVPNPPAKFQSWFPYNDLQVVVIIFVALGTLRGLATWAQTYVTSMVVIDFESRVRRQLIKWVFSSRSPELGRAVDIFNDKVTGASNYISSVINSISRITIAILLVISLFQSSVSMTLILLLFILILWSPIKYLNFKIQAATEHLHTRIASTMSIIILGIKNSLLLHISGSESYEEGRAQDSLREYRKGYARYHFYSGVKSVLPFIYGIWLVGFIAFFVNVVSNLAPEVLIAYLYLFLRFVQSLGELGSLASYITLTRPRMRVIWLWWAGSRIDTKEAYSEGTAKVGYNAATPERLIQGQIGWSLKNVWFRYNDQEDFVLKNLSLDIKPGSTLLIKGPSGSGKSTILSLLLGMQAPTKGEISFITFDNQLHSMVEKKTALLPFVGYVGPESFLIPGTVRENLNYGLNQPYSDQAIVNALKDAECKFIFDLADNLNHKITEQGEGLSAGQKQRLSLARALLRSPRVLILDEATANLDLKTELALVSTLKHLSHKLTICIVSHRSAFDDMADDTIILDNPSDCKYS